MYLSRGIDGSERVYHPENSIPPLNEVRICRRNCAYAPRVLGSPAPTDAGMGLRGWIFFILICHERIDGKGSFWDFKPTAGITCVVHTVTEPI